MKTHAILASFLSLGVAACGADTGAPRPPTPTFPTTLGPLVVTEVSASGDPDWFEVVNVSRSPVTLSEFVFVDRAGALDRAIAFPDGATLAPGAYFVQTVSDDQHGFQLGRDEELWIYRAADGGVSDGVDWDAGASPTGGSYALRGDEFVSMLDATRGAANE